MFKTFDCVQVLASFELHAFGTEFRIVAVNLMPYKPKWTRKNCSCINLFSLFALKKWIYHKISSTFRSNIVEGPWGILGYHRAGNTNFCFCLLFIVLLSHHTNVPNNKLNFRHKTSKQNYFFSSSVWITIWQVLLIFLNLSDFVLTKTYTICFKKSNKLEFVNFEKKMFIFTNLMLK